MALGEMIKQDLFAGALCWLLKETVGWTGLWRVQIVPVSRSIKVPSDYK